MALRGLGVWSLVGQQLTRQLLATSLLWKFGTASRLEFSDESFKNSLDLDREC